MEIGKKQFIAYLGIHFKFLWILRSISLKAAILNWLNDLTAKHFAESQRVQEIERKKATRKERETGQRRRTGSAPINL
jgi:hypothetical protein